MGMTIAEKILAAHAGLDAVEPGQLINAKVDIALANDVTAPVAIREFERSVQIRSLTKIGWCWCRITSPQQRPEKRRTSQNRAGVRLPARDHQLL